jgi:hypothetical protein
VTYYADLSPYEYMPSSLDAYNVGWLGKDHPYPTGSTLPAFRDRLLEYCSSPVEGTLALGYHDCEFCPKPETPVRVPWQDGEVSLGNGEIRVIGTDIIYASPTLIYHYVVEHDYLPPEEFVQAMLNGPGPGSGEYQILLSMIRGGFTAPDLSPEVKQRLYHQAGEAETQLTPDQLSQLLDGAKAGKSLSLKQLAQVLTTYGCQLEADAICELLQNTHVKHAVSLRSIKETISLKEFGMVLSLDQIVYIYQALDQIATPQQAETITNVLLDDLKTGGWDLRAPLPYLLREYARATGQSQDSRKFFSALGRKLGL